jgi:peptidoglycan hydrolase CwlO-like protein
LLLQIKDLEHQHIHQVKKQEIMEETMTRQKEEIEASKRKLHEMHGKHMTELKSAVQVHEEKLANSKQLLQELQAKYDKLLHERDTAVMEAKALRKKNKQRALVTTETPNTEFSIIELQKATKGFDAEFKISEDGFASIYKGFVRNTNLAIKLFHPRSLKGQARFYQEVVGIASL